MDVEPKTSLRNINFMLPINTYLNYTIGIHFIYCIVLLFYSSKLLIKNYADGITTNYDLALFYFHKILSSSNINAPIRGILGSNPLISYTPE